MKISYLEDLYPEGKLNLNIDNFKKIATLIPQFDYLIYFFVNYILSFI